jgi:hypothetical protein
MGSWLLQVAGFIAFVIDVFLGGTLVNEFFGAYAMALFVLLFVSGYVGLVLGPLAARSYDSE